MCNVYNVLAAKLQLFFRNANYNPLIFLLIFTKNNVQEIVIGGRSYDGVGNTTLLMAERFTTVHVRNVMVKAAEHGDVEPLRNYKNSCVLSARQGAVMVSPFISDHEKQVMQVLLREQLPFIYLADNGFRDYYKPSDALFDACAAGRVLILSPWPYDATKRHISRADCVALNTMAEEIQAIVRQKFA